MPSTIDTIFILNSFYDANLEIINALWDISVSQFSLIMRSDDFYQNDDRNSIYKMVD